MYSGRFFTFKSEEDMYKFAFLWEGQADQQICVADFIGDCKFKVVSCTPLGSIRVIERMSDNSYYYTMLPEPLIDAGEMLIFFSEVFVE